MSDSVCVKSKSFQEDLVIKSVVPSPHSLLDPQAEFEQSFPAVLVVLSEETGLPAGLWRSD